MPTKITSLTPSQANELPAFRQKYLELACDGRRADRGRLHEALAEAYALVGKPKPALLIVSSPAAGMLALAAMQSKQNGDQVWDQVWDQLGDQLWETKRSLWDGNFLWGTQDLYWIAWARFAQKIGAKLQAETCRRLGIMERISTECEWWWPRGGIVVASERPVDLKFDDMRRLHCEDGPAVRYADGYDLWAWHGTRVPKEWIAEKAITAQDALAWPNMEQRRAACEILGWASILSRLDARTIDCDADEQIGELIEVQIPDIGRERFLRVRCGTGREFALPVPPDMKTALQANAWTYGLDANRYQPEVRT